MRAVVVAVVECLDDDHARMQREKSIGELGLSCLVRRYVRRDLDELVSAADSVLPERGHTGKDAISFALRVATTESLQISLLGRKHVEERRCDRAVGAGRSHLQLVVTERHANIEQVQVRPLVVAECLDEQRLHAPDSKPLDLIDCKGMRLDSLAARSRHVALFERYGALLTKHQQEVLDLSLRSDWSLAEIAEHHGTSRAAVHDIVRRSIDALEEFEKRLGLLVEAGRRRRKLASLERDIAGLRRRVTELEA